jgi:hypothetical protein
MSKLLVFWRRDIACATVLVVVFGVAWRMTDVRSCETIDLPERRGVLDDRVTLVVVEDEQVFDHAKTKEIVLATFPNSAVARIVFCSSVHRHSLEMAQRGAVLLIGSRSENAPSFTNDNFLYVMFPTVSPPTGAITTIKGVVLTSMDPLRTSEWLTWCEARKIPSVKVIARDIASATEGIRIAQDLIVRAQEKSPK